MHICNSQMKKVTHLNRNVNVLPMLTGIMCRGFLFNLDLRGYFKSIIYLPVLSTWHVHQIKQQITFCFKFLHTKRRLVFTLWNVICSFLNCCTCMFLSSLSCWWKKWYNSTYSKSTFDGTLQNCINIVYHSTKYTAHIGFC